MSGIGAGAFVEGLQGGIASRDAMDRNKQIKQLRAQGIERGKNELAGERGQALTDYMQQGGDQAGFDEEWGAFQQDKDPALLRFGKWIGGKLGGMFGGQGEEESAQAQMGIAAPSVEVGQAPGGMKPTYRNGGIVSRQRYADGGEVEETDEMKRQRAQAAQSTAALERRMNGEDAGGMRGFAEDVGRSAANVFDDTRRSALAGDEDISESFDKLRNSKSAGEAGGAFTDWAVDSARSAGATTIGLAKDVFVDNPVTQFGLGMLGFDGKADEGIPAAQGATSPEAAAIGASVDNPDAPDEQVAQVAIKEAQEESIKNLDYKLLVDQGVRPEELPSMSTTDWSEYRMKMTMYAMQSGDGLNEAHKMVDDRITNMQMTGFQREGQKAMLYLQTGQNREAAMALRQAYQYFPNGVTVKFGTMTDPKTGQPAIMTMGTDEETGEPTGSPMLITVERLTTMMENMSNPQAFRTWTKDGRDMQLKINELQSIDDYRQGSLDISAANAETNRIDALSGAAGGGMTAGERRQRDGVYADAMDKSGFMEKGFEEPGTQRSLASAMSLYEQLSGIRDMNTIMNEVMTAYESDPENGVQRLLAKAKGQ